MSRYKVMDAIQSFFISNKQQSKPVKKSKAERAFKAAFNSRFIDWLFTTRHKINLDLVNQLGTLISRSRDLSVNNQLFRSFLSNTQKTVVGAQGFQLKMQIVGEDGKLDTKLNQQIQAAWKDFTSKKNLTISEQWQDIDLDTLILRTLLVDGQVFIQILKDPDSPFGIRFRLIDSLAVDIHKLQIMTETQNGIYNGVQVDQNYKPVRYWLRRCYNGNYDSGQLYSLPADQIIHIYKPEFIDQVRGYSTIVASLDTLKQLDDYAVAELIAAKVASCQGVFYERNNDVPVGNFIGQQEDDIDRGSFLSELSPGIASIVPKGYSIKSVQTNHPNADFNGFNKSLVKRVGASIGTCYNRINKDYSDVNYSSLKQANIDQNNTTKMWQRFLIDNWKNVQFELFLKNYIINSLASKLNPSEYKKYIHSFRFIPKVDPYTDPAKQIIAIEKKIKMGLTSHIAQIQKAGLDYNEVINDEQKWNEACKEKGLNFNIQNNPHETFEDSNEIDEDNK